LQFRISFLAGNLALLPVLPMDTRESRQPFQVVLAIAALLVIAGTLTLRTVTHPVVVHPTSDNPTPLGYTWSLLLFIIPIAALAWWFVSRPDLKFPRAAFWRTIAVLAPVGFLLDLLFGNAFFVFQNKPATLGIDIPARGGAIPIEEFVFYLTGFMLVLLSYIWCDEYWMSAYNIPDYEAATIGMSRIVRFHFASVILGLVLIVGAVVYRKFFSAAPAGFPWYFIYLTCASLIPSAGFFKTAQRFINWRAFSFTFFLVLLISLLWEVTLALPYGWWRYHDESMIGLKIGAWSDLPIEAPCVWMAVTFTTVIVYEVIKIWKALGRRGLSAFFGIADTKGG
jgi:Lycopene cyclase